MVDRLREFFKSPAGMGVAGVVVVVCLFMAVSTLRGFVTTEAGDLSANRMFMDATTDKPFRVKLKEGDPMPVKAPSGGYTGWPAEECYWTKDGKEKPEPTYVLLNLYKKKTNEPTFCPDCGRLVVGHNPPPSDGRGAPPTKEDYEKRRGGSGSRR